jgi:peptidoglycan/LPS O-acetylase OafA/YrhL
MDLQIERFWLLDNLRGLASLSVVFFHYKHFYWLGSGALPQNFNKNEQPFYYALAPFYDFGFHAVQLFFILSGFVFFLVYYHSIFRGSVNWRQFLGARFSRLYPLHALTLVFVAFGQFISFKLTNHFFVYPINDLYHFVLNCLLAPAWGFQSGESFNGPSWSVSVEVLLYGAFFLYVSKRIAPTPAHLLIVLALCFLAYLVSRQAPESVATIMYSAVCFAMGGIIFAIWDTCSRWKQQTQIWLTAGLLAWSCAGLVLFAAGGHRLSLDFIAFPAIILSLAIAQGFSVDAGKSVRMIGDVSYTAYLLHFPLQLLIFVVAAYYQIRLNFNRPEILLLFLVTLFILSILTHYYFERPAQYYIRKKIFNLKVDTVKSHSIATSLYQRD